MTDDEKARIEKAATEKALKEAQWESRIKDLEDSMENIENAVKDAVKWFFRALWGGVAYIFTQIASVLLSGGWPK